LRIFILTSPYYAAPWRSFPKETDFPTDSTLRDLNHTNMNPPHKSDHGFEPRLAANLLEVLSRASLILILAIICYRVFSPFLTLMLWALILAVSLYPLHQLLARRIGNRQGLASTTLVLAVIVLIITPTALLVNSFGDSVTGFIQDVQANSLEIPAPHDSVAGWPVVGKKLHDMWSLAHNDLPSFVQSLQPKIGDLTKWALGFVAAIGVGLLRFLAALVIAAIIMAFGEQGERGSLAIFNRIIGPKRGAEFARLSTATIRAVAQGVIGVAFIQAIIVGLCLLVAGVPWAGALSVVVLVLGIAQIPAAIVTLPAIIYLWSSENYSTGAAIAFTLLLFVAGMADNVLKPLMLGRGVDAPMPVILLGALGGMAAEGILGMFVGATLLALGYQIFMGWVEEKPGVEEVLSPAEVVTKNGQG
jgi:predicted PurR-regulated permease PerM